MGKVPGQEEDWENANPEKMIRILMMLLMMTGRVGLEEEWAGVTDGPVSEGADPEGGPEEVPEGDREGVGAQDPDQQNSYKSISY
jgi:hypothetical protein